MKKFLLGILAVSVIVAVATFVLQPTESVDWVLFEPRLSMAIEGAGLSLRAERPGNSRDISLPLMVRWQNRSTESTGKVQYSIGGFPDACIQHTLSRDGVSKIECLTQYLNGRAVFIEIRSTNKDGPAASKLRNSLAEQFPGLPIRIRTHG